MSATVVVAPIWSRAMTVSTSPSASRLASSTCHVGDTIGATGRAGSGVCPDAVVATHTTKSALYMSGPEHAERSDASALDRDDLQLPVREGHTIPELGQSSELGEGISPNRRPLAIGDIDVMLGPHIDE